MGVPRERHIGDEPAAGGGWVAVCAGWWRCLCWWRWRWRWRWCCGGGGAGVIVAVYMVVIVVVVFSVVVLVVVVLVVAAAVVLQRLRQRCCRCLPGRARPASPHLEPVLLHRLYHLCTADGRRPSVLRCPSPRGMLSARRLFSRLPSSPLLPPHLRSRPARGRTQTRQTCQACSLLSASLLSSHFSSSAPLLTPPSSFLIPLVSTPSPMNQHTSPRCAAQLYDLVCLDFVVPGGGNRSHAPRSGPGPLVREPAPAALLRGAGGAEQQGTCRIH